MFLTTFNLLIYLEFIILFIFPVKPIEIKEQKSRLVQFILSELDEDQSTDCGANSK